MFERKLREQVKALEEEWKHYAQLQEGDLETTTESGIKIKPVYTPADIADTDYKEIGFPGQYPFTRGLRPHPYQVEPWLIRFLFGYGGGKETRERWEFLKKVGMYDFREEDGLPNVNLATDLPTQRGYDPDAPEAEGWVGECGTSLSTIREFEGLFDGLPLDKVRASFIADDPTLVVMAMYIVYAERRGYPAEKLDIWPVNRLYRQWCWETICYTPKHAYKLMVEAIHYHIKHLRPGRALVLSGYLMGECGATAVQEVAFMLALAISIAEECIHVGLDPDDFAPRMQAHPHLGMDFFEEIAKLRALRRMWANIFKERFGCRKPESLQLKCMSSQTGGIAFTAQEPLNNVIRATLMTLVGVLGGSQSICTSGYDEALNVPSEEAVHLAIRTNQIIYHETNIPKVIDPLAGSYYMEWLTNRIEQEAGKLLEQIEQLGGALRCWESGWFRKEEARASNERQAAIDRGEKIIVGVNKYVLEQRRGSISRTFRVDPQVEQELLARVRRFRAQRDNARAQAALAQLRAVTQSFIEEWPNSCGTLMPALIEAARADATLGEMCQVLQEVCGYGYPY